MHTFNQTSKTVREKIADILIERYPNWVSVKEVSTALGKKDPYKTHRDILEKFVAEGYVERRIEPAGIALRYVYRWNMEK